MAKTRLQRDTEATPQQAFVEMTELDQTDPVTGASATVVVTAPEDDGAAEVALQASAFGAAIGSVFANAGSDDGEALVQNSAVSGTGNATVRSEANADGGTAEARLAVRSGATVLVGVTATAEAGVATSLVITDGAGSDASSDPGYVLTSDAVAGSLWAPISSPLVSAGAIVLSAGSGQTTLTLNADGSSALTINGYGDVLAIAADGTVTLVPLAFLVIGLPSVDPSVAGAVYTDGAVSGGVPQALMVSGGPP